MEKIETTKFNVTTLNISTSNYTICNMFSNKVSDSVKSYLDAELIKLSAYLSSTLKVDVEKVAAAISSYGNEAVPPTLAPTNVVVPKAKAKAKTAPVTKPVEEVKPKAPAKAKTSKPKAAAKTLAPEPPVVEKVAEPEPPKPAASKGKGKAKAKVPEEAHTCGRTINTRDAGARLCGAKAINELDGNWYCGPHFKAVEKKSTKDQIKNSEGVAAKPPPALRGEALINKIVKQENVNLAQVGDHWLDLKTRICFSNDTNEAYGRLAADNLTVQRLNENDIRFLEVHNMKFKQPPRVNPPKSKASVAPTPVATLQKAVKEAVVEAAPDAEEEVEEEVVPDAEDEEINLGQAEDDENGGEAAPLVEEDENGAGDIQEDGEDVAEEDAADDGEAEAEEDGGEE